jgi:hypothetical protein
LVITNKNVIFYDLLVKKAKKLGSGFSKFLKIPVGRKRFFGL